MNCWVIKVYSFLNCYQCWLWSMSWFDILRISFSPPVYDLRSRTVYGNQASHERLPYTDRLVNYMSDLCASCLMGAISFVFKVLFSPMAAFSYIAGKAVGRTSERYVSIYLVWSITKENIFLTIFFFLFFFL